MIICSNKTLAQLASDYSNGLGQLQCIDPLVTEELNGTYELEFNILVSDPHFDDLEVGSVLKTTANDHDGLQMFRVYYISKELNGQCTVRAQHITYDLTKTPVSTFTATGAISACANMMSHVIGTTEFSLTTDITNTVSNFTLDIPRSFRECLGGYEGSLLDVFRGEYHWDNLNIEMLAHRGHDNGVRIAYGKNLTDLKQEESIDSVYTSVLGYAVVDEVCYIGTVYDKIVTSNPKVKIVDFSSDYESGNVPTSAELTTKAQNYATNNDIEIPNVNLTISFIHLWQTEEYKDVLPIERVSLGDTVHVYFEKLGVETSARVIKTTWNPNLERYESIELGSARANLNTILNDVANETIETIKSSIDIDTTAIESEMNSITNLIVNGMGLHKSVAPNGLIYLHNEESLAQSQYQYRISSGGFELSDDYGQTWNSGWDISGNAVMNALSTITLRALQVYGSYIQGSQIVFGDPDTPGAKYITAQPYSDGVTFDGTGTIRMQPQDRFYINNLASNGTDMYNQFIMNKLASNQANMIEMLNKDDTQGYLTANFFELDAHLLDSSNEVYNRSILHNYSTASGTHYEGNYLQMSSYADRNYSYFRNFKPLQAMSSTTRYYANYLMFSAAQTSDSAFIINNQLSSNQQANRLEMVSDTSKNQALVNNNMRSSAYVANQLLLYSSSYENIAYLNNIKRTSTATSSIGLANLANRVRMSAESSLNNLWIENFRPTAGSELYANCITMVGTPTLGGGTNSITIENYDVDGSNLANEFTMSKSTGNNYIGLRLNRGGQTVAQIGMSRQTDGTLYVEMKTLNNNDFNYKSARIYLTGDGYVNLEGEHLRWNGTVIR